MKIVILGAGGQLATDVEKVMSDWELFPLRHADLDVCNHAAVRKRLTEIEPEAVINTAAFHRVDDCEDQVEKAFQVNAYAVRNLAQICADLDCRLVHISTDYVFGGDKRTPYTEDDPPHPLNVYGVSKLCGEYFVRYVCPNHMIIRTSGLYGVTGSSGKGGNFVETMIRLAKEGKPIRVVEDQVLAPTYTLDLAMAIRGRLESGQTGLVHLAGGGECSWYEFAKAIFELARVDADLSPTTTSEYQLQARRPPYSVLASAAPEGRAPVNPLGPWKQGLSKYLAERAIRPLRQYDVNAAR
jgi:dTDP-4-dehydrorhamnose reductase